MVDCKVDQASKSERRRRFVPREVNDREAEATFGNTVESIRPIERHVKGA